MLLGWFLLAGPGMAGAEERSLTDGALYPAVPVSLPRAGSPYRAGDDRGPVSGRPAHPVWFEHDLLAGRAEVTQAQYAALTGKRPSSFAGCGEDCPVENVSWYEAVAFADLLSAREGLPPCGASVDCAGWRLPTEAEWEYLAQGPVRRATGWYAENSGGTPRPVCSAPEPLNALGLCDTAGNVYEWVYDRYERFAYVGIAEGALNPVYDRWDAFYRQRRGGSWADAMESADPARRLMLEAGQRHSHVGFRLVRTIIR